MCDLHRQMRRHCWIGIQVTRAPFYGDLCLFPKRMRCRIPVTVTIRHVMEANCWIGSFNFFELDPSNVTITTRRFHVLTAEYEYGGEITVVITSPAIDYTPGLIWLGATRLRIGPGEGRYTYRLPGLQARQGIGDGKLVTTPVGEEMWIPHCNRLNPFRTVGVLRGFWKCLPPSQGQFDQGLCCLTVPSLTNCFPTRFLAKYMYSYRSSHWPLHWFTWFAHPSPSSSM
jgi:hypothetical protein